MWEDVTNKEGVDMFICKECITKSQKTGSCVQGHYFISIGSCEMCHNHGECVDCNCHKLTPEQKHEIERIDRALKLASVS
jgi:hypothetical protein